MAKKKAISKRKKSKVAKKIARKTKMKASPKKMKAAAKARKTKSTAKRTQLKKSTKAKKTAKQTRVPKRKELSITQPANQPTDQMVEQRPSLAVTGDQAHANSEYLDGQRTSRKRRRTSGQAYTGATREEQRRVAALEVTAMKDVRERIRAPHRSPNQNRSR